MVNGKKYYSMIGLFNLLRLMGYPVKEARKTLALIQKQDDLLVWQKTSKWDIAEFHFQNNPFYNKFLEEWPSRWEDFPILKKADLQGDWRLKVPESIKDFYVSSTSGSSGYPLFYAKDRLTQALIWLSIAENFRTAGIEINDFQARFYGIPLSFFSKMIELMKDFFLSRYRFVVFDLDDAILQGWLKKFGKRKFRYLYGYTNSLVVFAKYLVDKRVVLNEVCPTLTACIVTSEMCGAAEIQLLEKGFGVKIYNEYGASEVCVLGFSSGERWRVSDELGYLEVVDEKGEVLLDGQCGRLLCTLLHNRGTPIIRYEVGDLASIERIGGHTYITQLFGRTNDLVILPSGRKIPGFTFYYIAKNIFEQNVRISEYRVIQRGITSFELEYVGSVDLDESRLLRNVQDSFDKYIEQGLNVSIKKVPSIDRSGNGKFKHFIKLYDL